MDQSEVLRMISTFNSRWALSERRLAKYQQELATVRQTLAQTNRDLEEVAKLAELLYETNRRMGLITDYLLECQILKSGDEEPKSFDAMFNWVAEKAGLSPGAGEEDEDAASGANALLEMSNANN